MEEDALHRVVHYERRWVIEEYLKVLLHGTNLLNRWLREAASIENCLGVDAVLAWTVFDGTRVAVAESS